MAIVTGKITKVELNGIDITDQIVSVDIQLPPDDHAFIRGPDDFSFSLTIAASTVEERIAMLDLSHTFFDGRVN